MTKVALALADLGFTGSWRQPDESDHSSYQARTGVAAFEVALRLFEEDCGRLPSASEGLAALTTRPSNAPEARWRGPYREILPKDPWGHDYIYLHPGVHNTNRFD